MKEITTILVVYSLNIHLKSINKFILDIITIIPIIGKNIHVANENARFQG
jgi:hypothetical protein